MVSPGAQVELADLRGRDVDVVGPGQVAVLGGAQEAEPVGQDLQHALGEDEAFLLRLRAQDLEDQLLLLHGGRARDLQRLRHLGQLGDAHLLERGEVEAALVALALGFAVGGGRDGEGGGGRGLFFRGGDRSLRGSLFLSDRLGRRLRTPSPRSLGARTPGPTRRSALGGCGSRIVVGHEVSRYEVEKTGRKGSSRPALLEPDGLTIRKPRPAVNGGTVGPSSPSPSPSSSPSSSPSPSPSSSRRPAP